MEAERLENISDDTIRVNLDSSIYSKEAILSATYLVLDRCFVHLRSYNENDAKVDIKRKSSECDLTSVALEFCNMLVAEELRHSIEERTRTIREKIVNEAFVPLQASDTAADT